MVKSIIEEMGLTSTTGMKMSTYNKVVERLVEICTAHKAELEAEEGTKMTVQPKNKATGGKGR